MEPMRNRTFLIVLILIGILLTGVVYMHVPRSQATTHSSSLHGGR